MSREVTSKEYARELGCSVTQARIALDNMNCSKRLVKVKTMMSFNKSTTKKLIKYTIE